MTFRVTISTRTALVLMVLALLAVPATATATHIFGDVSDTNVHAAGIEWVKDAGVTVGCTATEYCPGDPVTRAQMGTFMYRLSGNDPATPPSVNADLVDGFHASHLLRVVFDQTDNAPDRDEDAVSAVIAVPQDGFLIMSGGMDAIGDTLDAYGCRLMVDGTEVTGTERLSVVHFAGSGHTFNGSENCSTTGVEPVTAGLHTVALNIFGRDTVFFEGASVWALYVPFSGTPFIIPPVPLP